MSNNSEAPAYRFIQQSLRGNADFGLASDIATASGFDWNTLLHVASTERLSPLLFHALNDKDIAPIKVLQQLGDSYAYNARRNLLLLHELSCILRTFEESGIDVIVLKGAALAEVVYENIALRPMGDLDLLIQKDQVLDTIQVITSHGYSLDERTNLAGSLDFENEVQLNKPGVEEIGLDLHWNFFAWLFYIESIPLDWIWQTSSPVELGDQQSNILGPEAQLLHLCAHTIINHGFGKNRLLWLIDICEVIQFYENQLDWDLFLETAQNSSLVLPVQRVLPWVAARLDAPIPDEVLELCNQMRATPGEIKTLELSSFQGRTMVQRVLSDLSNISNWSERWRYLNTFVFRKLFAPPANLRDRYEIQHTILLPIYYIYWLFNGLAELMLLLLKYR